MVGMYQGSVLSSILCLWLIVSTWSSANQLLHIDTIVAAAVVGVILHGMCMAAMSVSTMVIEAMCL